MTERIITDSNGRKHITNEPQLHPPQRIWVGLTDEEFEAIWKRFGCYELMREIEAKLKEKNT
jgi:hypothetical protein